MPRSQYGNILPLRRALLVLWVLLGIVALCIAVVPRRGSWGQDQTSITSPVSGDGTAGSSTSRGLTGEYFDDLAFADLALTRIDPTIDFNWGTDAPYPALDPETFAVRWRGEIWIEVTDEYTFTTMSDDEVRLWVDGERDDAR